MLRNNLLLCAAIFLGLELWRPCFFLTDDNLDGGFPFFTEVGRHLLAGRSPFVSDYLFGGHYDLLRDPTYFAWNPIYLMVSLLEGTPLHNWIIDVDAFALFLLTTAGFVNLAWYLRREYALRVSDGWLMFYTVSFTYSMIALTTASSWITFMGNQSALPWLALGILQRSWWRGIGLVALFSMHQILGGHLEPTVSSTLFLSLFAVGVSAARRSWAPIGWWAAGYTLAVFLLLPLLIPMMSGFLSTTRSHGVDPQDMQGNNIPLSLFPTSFFFGMALWIVNPPVHAFTTYTYALASCAAAWCILPAMASRRSWRDLELVVLGLMILIIFLVSRPMWIIHIMERLPVLKSMRWPFRELLQFQFFFHLFLLLRRPGFTPVIRHALAVLGLGLLVIPLLLYRLPPTFNAMAWDRELLLSGGFDQFWTKVRPLLQPDDRVVTLIPMRLYSDDRFQEPYSLLAAYNYPCLTQVIGTGGWSQTTPAGQLYLHTQVDYPFHAFVPEKKAALLKEHPDVKFITLVSLRPLKLTLSSAHGATIDLTPFVPERIHDRP